ncbi:unnamed protein product [Miscanthus lutarioriparius]|uniref:DUF4378 domain-containing protein n=1 Tax=Miscanthus lutarioriparius TaxID=422564 RepID=A0A811QKR2_9POAL|nr:unnamed protein product [Miscanthus lutarioriparius]
MACLSPSPSGRRLSELLEEKQEPFVLDLHLLEKGCSSSRLLDGYDTTALCWPAAAAAVLRRHTSKKSKATARATGGGNKQKPAGGLLQLLLSKILRGSSRAAAAQRKPATLQFSDSFKLVAADTATNPAAVLPAPCSDRDRHMELDAVKTAAAAADAKWQDAAERYDSDSDSDDEKQQLSPVSVLDHPFESSPVHGKLLLSPSSKGAAAMDVFRDLLDAAYSPALLAQLLAKSEDLLLRDAAVADEDDDCCYYGGGYRTSPKHCRDDESAAAYWDAHREELARVSELVASELPISKLSAADVQPERRDVGAEVADAVFEALMRELVVDLQSCCC